MSDHVAKTDVHAAHPVKAGTARFGAVSFGLCPAVETRNNRRSRCYVPDTPPKRPDPGLYSQSERFAQGQAMSWDSPDLITNHAFGALFNEIKITVRNHATEAPALGTQVRYAWAPWSIGILHQELFSIRADLNRAGLPGDEVELVYPMPAWLKDEHDNISVRAIVVHPHDREAINNMGEQAYLGVRAEAGTRREIEIPVHNHLPVVATFDLYVQETGWNSGLSDTQVTLNPGQTQNVIFGVTPQSGSEAGMEFNIVARHGAELYGGVHIHVKT